MDADLAGGTDSMVRNSDLERSAMQGGPGRAEWHLANGSPLGGWDVVRLRGGAFEFLCPDGQVRAGRFDRRRARWAKQQNALAAISRATQPTKGVE